MENKKVKIIGLGDTGVGKTTFFKNITNKDDLITCSTIGVDYHTVDVDNYHLMFWDTGGMEQYKSITKSYLRDKHLYILFFDLSEYSSYTHLSRWIDLIKKYNSDELLFDKIIFIGTKSDLIKNNTVYDVYENKNINLNHYNYQKISRDDPDLMKEAFNLIFDKIKNINITNVNPLDVSIDVSVKKKSIFQSLKNRCCF
jgi:small GTP-binding protein